MTSEPPSLLDVRVERSIAASPERIFRAWTEPALMRRWFDARQLVMDPRVGGLFFIEVHWQGRLWAHYGRYLRIDPPHRLEFTWMSEATGGRDTTVAIDFVAVDNDHTELRLVQSGLPDGELGRGHEKGWQDSVTAIASDAEAKA